MIIIFYALQGRPCTSQKLIKCSSQCWRVYLVTIICVLLGPCAQENLIFFYFSEGDCVLLRPKFVYFSEWICVLLKSNLCISIWGKFVLPDMNNCNSRNKLVYFSKQIYVLVGTSSHMKGLFCFFLIIKWVYFPDKFCVLLLFFNSCFWLSNFSASTSSWDVYFWL